MCPLASTSAPWHKVPIPSKYIKAYCSPYLTGFGIHIPKPEELKDGLHVILGLQGGQSSEHDGAVASTVQLVHLTDTCVGRVSMG